MSRKKEAFYRPVGTCREGFPFNNKSAANEELL